MIFEPLIHAYSCFSASLKKPQNQMTDEIEYRINENDKHNLKNSHQKWGFRSEKIRQNDQQIWKKN